MPPCKALSRQRSAAEQTRPTSQPPLAHLGSFLTQAKRIAASCTQAIGHVSAPRTAVGVHRIAPSVQRVSFACVFVQVTRHRKRLLFLFVAKRPLRRRPLPLPLRPPFLPLRLVVDTGIAHQVAPRLATKATAASLSAATHGVQRQASHRLQSHLSSPRALFSPRVLPRQPRRCWLVHSLVRRLGPMLLAPRLLRTAARRPTVLHSTIRR